MRRILLAGILIGSPYLQAMDNFHFYRAGYFPGEPRLERPWLTSLNASFGAGSTCTSFNRCGEKTCLLNLYGPFNMQLLGEGVPNKSTTNPVDITLINLALLPERDGFGQLLFEGHFSIKEAMIWFTQNLSYGFFFEVNFPIRSLEINNIDFKDLSPHDDITPNINTPVWQTFLNLFPQVLARYNLVLENVHRRGVGDTVVLLGWTHNFQETELIDYVDTTFKLGVLAPSGKVKNPSIIFDLPLGYDGHVGAPIEFDGSFGCFDWLTVGAGAGGIIFGKKTKKLHMKTNVNQNGYIKLAEGLASVKKGNLWYADAYFKADHFCRGLSFLIGYSFVRENPDIVRPCNTQVFDEMIVDSDQMFKKWQMHTIHLWAEYDFTQEWMWVGPHISAFYNRQIAGKRTFNTSLGGGMFGVDIAWAF